MQPTPPPLPQFLMPQLAPHPATPDELSRLRKVVDTSLAHYLEFGPGCPARLAEAMQYVVLAPGKRLRPLLVLLASRACGGDVNDAMPAACAVELVHAYSLAHDDLPAMDDDDLRRGRPTCHKAFDEATAILVGDALQARAFEILATAPHAPFVVARWCGVLAGAAGAEQLVGGQADDLAGIAASNSLEHLQFIHRRKTGAMICASLAMGGISAGASDAQLVALNEYGERLGLVFQITDDLLDAKGNAEQVGKQVGKDAGRGKLTYPILMGIESSREQVRQLVAEACDAVGSFGEAAAPLQYIARSLVDRTT